MSRKSSHDPISAQHRGIVRRLLDGYGQTYAQELGIRLRPQGQSGTFRLLCAALLFSARIGAEIAVRGAQALAKAGWTTPRKMTAATWDQRTRVLNRSGYARYDEKTSQMLADTSQLLLEKYGGDLRKLRAAAEREPARERELLKECKGIGDVGGDIFFREIQAVWTELYPFADTRSLRSARKLPVCRRMPKHWRSWSRAPPSPGLSPRWCASIWTRRGQRLPRWRGERHRRAPCAAGESARPRDRARSRVMNAKSDQIETDDTAEVEDESDQSNDSGPSFFQRPAVLIVGGILLIAAIVGGVFYWLHARQFESTDDAFIDAHVVRVAPQIAAKVLEVPVDDNQAVKAGDVLVALDPRDFEVQVAQAKAGLTTAEGKLAEAEAQVQVAEAGAGQAEAQIKVAEAKASNAAKDFERSEQLRENKVVSKQELDAATENKTSTSASLDAARRAARASTAQVSLAQSQVVTAGAGVTEARAALQQAETQLSYTTIRATEEGRVTNRSVTPGNFVAIGQALLAVVPRRVWVKANFKETQLTLMRPGQPVTIEVDAYPDREFTGKVESIQAGSGAAFSLLPPENATGNYVKVVQRVPVKIIFDELPSADSPILLAPGMSVVPEVKVR